MRNWTKPYMEKIVSSDALQLDLESRRLWRLLTSALAGYMTEMEVQCGGLCQDDKRYLQFFDIKGITWRMCSLNSEVAEQ